MADPIYHMSMGWEFQVMDEKLHYSSHIQIVTAIAFN